VSYFNSVNVLTNMPDTLATGNITTSTPGAGNTTQIAMAGHKSCSFAVSGAWTGTLVMEFSLDGGTTWTRAWIQSVSASSSYEILQAVNSLAANGSYASFLVAGVTHYRIRATTDTVWSGTAAIKLSATEVAGAIFASTSVIQNVLADLNNVLSIGSGSPLNLAASGVYAGTASSTLGVAGIQVNIAADQNLTVYVDQSNGMITGQGAVTTNGTTTLAGAGTRFLRDFNVGDQIWVTGETVRVVTGIASDVSLTVSAAFSTSAGGLAYTQYPWDIKDSFNYYTGSGGASWTTQATASYFRVRLVNVGSSPTTFIRLQAALCPIVEAVPRALSANGNLKVGVYEIEDQNTGQLVGISAVGELRTTKHVRLAGAYFSGSTFDTNFWLLTPTTGGTATQANGALTLNTGAGPDGGALVTSTRIGRYISGAPNYFRAVVRVPALAGVGANVRRWGAFDANDGFFFSTNGTTLSLTCRKATSDANTVASGAFNGTNGLSYVLDANAHVYEIYYENRSAYFYIDGKYIHKFSAPTTTLVASLHLKVGFQNQNSGGSADLNTLEIRVASINRMGEPVSRPTFRYQAGALAATVLKYGPGTLHRVVMNKVANNITLTLYDSTNTGAPTLPICIVTLVANGTPATLPYDLDFVNGLLVVITGAGDFTIVYE
jgi:hypothetical protein